MSLRQRCAKAPELVLGVVPDWILWLIPESAPQLVTRVLLFIIQR